MTQETIKNFIETILKKIQIPFDSIDVEENDNQTVFQIRTKEGGTLIGNRGEVIRALTHITKRTHEESDKETHFLIDVNEYRIKKIKELKKTAHLLAERARSLKYNVEMTPMSAYERMIVHSALADAPNIATESHGEGRDRRVVICYTEE